MNKPEIIDFENTTHMNIDGIKNKLEDWSTRCKAARDGHYREAEKLRS